MSHQPSLHPPAAPLVVQLGFAGSRNLYDAKEHPGIDAAVFAREVETYLVSLLEGFPEMLSLSPQHFLCAISSAACGADTVFLRACEKAWKKAPEKPDFSHRVFLPERRDAFFAATNKHGIPDFTPDQVKETSPLLDSPRIIEKRVVSDSSKRPERFEDVNLEIVRVSNVLIALVRENSAGKRGGTLDLVQRAQSRKKPLLQVTVSVHEGHARCKKEWLIAPSHPPGVPFILADFQCPLGKPYIATLKKFASDKAELHQARFTSAAIYIIGFHVAATFLAVVGLAFYDAIYHMHLLEVLLGIEIVFLARGLAIHHGLHGSSDAEHWATARLVAEVLRSVDRVSPVRGYLAYLFFLPLPKRLGPVWRTLSFFHLRDVRDSLPHEASPEDRAADPKPMEEKPPEAKPIDDDWHRRRCTYVSKRLTHRKSGQIAYYTRERDKARWQHDWAQKIFYLFSGLAIAATLVKLMIKLNHPEIHYPDQHPAAPWLAACAIFFPVVAVAALSWAASRDLEARLHTYGEMLTGLQEMRAHLLAATSEREFTHLAMQTEARLVGENASWFSRRIYTGVA